MLTSLKALLFPAAPTATGVTALPAADAANFATLLSGTMAAVGVPSPDAAIDAAPAFPVIDEASGDEPVATPNFLNAMPAGSPARPRVVIDNVAVAAPLPSAVPSATHIPASRPVQSAPDSAPPVSAGPEAVSAAPPQIDAQPAPVVAAPVPFQSGAAIAVPVPPAAEEAAPAPVENIRARPSVRVSSDSDAVDKGPRVTAAHAPRIAEAVEASDETDRESTEQLSVLAGSDAPRQPTPPFASTPVTASAPPVHAEARSEASSGSTVSITDKARGVNTLPTRPHLATAPTRHESHPAGIAQEGDFAPVNVAMPDETSPRAAMVTASPPSPAAAAVPAPPAPADEARVEISIPVAGDKVAMSLSEPSPAVEGLPLPSAIVSPPEPANDAPVRSAVAATPAMPVSVDVPMTTPLATQPVQVGRSVVTGNGPTLADVDSSGPLASSAPDAIAFVQTDAPPAHAPTAPMRAELRATITPEIGDMDPAIPSPLPMHPAAAALDSPSISPLPKGDAAKPSVRLDDAGVVIAPATVEAKTPSPDAKLPLAAPVEIAKPVKFEALSLLTLVRDQFRARVGGEKDDRGKIAPKPVASTAAIIAPDTPLAPVIQAAPPTPTVMTPLQAAPPVVDLSASIGAQLVDMGVSGQWIDGLARDIAGLSADGAQGRFQINTEQLGHVQVDIRRGVDGAAVSLTVATQAAEMALRKDRDRLDTGLGPSAVRITELKIERATVVEPAASADASRRQGDQPATPQTGGDWQTAGQGMGQSAGQGRWQARENFAPPHKIAADMAVLQQADARESVADGVRRAAGGPRYA